jgi:hypothetical protein
MTEVKNPGKEKIDELLGSFEDKYHKVLSELDSVYRGTFDEDEASSMSAMCLITQAALFAELSSADLRTRALKRDIDFAKAKAYESIKNTPAEKKVTESALAQLIIKDTEVQRLTKEQNEAETEYKHLANIHALLKEAHITFRLIKKGA